MYKVSGCGTHLLFKILNKIASVRSMLELLKCIHMMWHTYIIDRLPKKQLSMRNGVGGCSKNNYIIYLPNFVKELENSNMPLKPLFWVLAVRVSVAKTTYSDDSEE